MRNSVLVFACAFFAAFREMIKKATKIPGFLRTNSEDDQTILQESTKR
jgi:hypothetical protein